MTSLPVFGVGELPNSGEIELDPAEAHHAVVVRRLGVGAELLVTDGHSAAARCRIDEVSASAEGRKRAATPRVWLRVAEHLLVPSPRPRLTLVQALIKGDRGELAVQTATEAGVDEVVPWAAQRCVARWEPGPRGEKAREKWAAALTSAAKQARRLDWPLLAEQEDSQQLEQRSRDAARAGDAVLLLHETAERSLVAHWRRQFAEHPPGHVLVIVGPEGGIAEAELERLAAAGATPVRLGPSVLRASSAAAVTSAAVHVLSGRWG